MQHVRRMIFLKTLANTVFLVLVLSACGLGGKLSSGGGGGSDATSLRQSDDADFRAAQSLHTAAAYRKYIELHPTGAHARRAGLLVEQISYYDVMSRMKPNELEAFIRKYPESRFASTAQEELQKAEFSKAKRDDSIKNYRAFIERHRKYPSEWTAAATQRLERLLLDRAKASSNVLTLTRHIHDNPGSPYMAEAREALKQASYERAMNSKVADDWDAFIRRYPRSREAEIVARHMKKEELRVAERSRSAAALEKYLERYPKTPHRGRILASLTLMSKTRDRRASRWVKIKEAEIDVYRPRKCPKCEPVLRVHGTLSNTDRDFAYDLVLEAEIVIKGGRCCRTSHSVRALAPGESRLFTFTIPGIVHKGRPPAYKLRIKSSSTYRNLSVREKEPPAEIETSGEKAPVDSFKPVPVPPLGKRR
jgi:outer membrane protein assembly factor BamD (BamD/ComL family)